MRRGDRWLLALPVALAMIGLVMVYSSSAILGITRHQDPNYFLSRQLVRALLGVAAMLLCTRLDLGRLERWAPWLLGASVALLLGVAVAGVAAKGAERWLRLGFLSIQPTDIARVTLVVFLAAWLARRPPDEHGLLHGVLWPLGVAAGVAGLVAAQPNLSSAAMLTLIALVMVYLAGVRLRHLLVPAGAGAAALSVVLLSHPYMIERARTFWDFLVHGTLDARGSGWQLDQSLIALGSGGLVGRGLGSGMQKYLFLPEAHTDFILSILGEELGWMGCSLLLAMFGALIWRGLRVAVRAPDPFGALLAAGLTAQIGLYALVNVAVATGLAPTTGLPLPFVSYGGSALVVNLAAAGLLYAVSCRAGDSEALGRARWRGSAA
jgi:cell division protein FtsW